MGDRASPGAAQGPPGRIEAHRGRVLRLVRRRGREGARRDAHRHGAGIRPQPADRSPALPAGRTTAHPQQRLRARAPARGRWGGRTGCSWAATTAPSSTSPSSPCWPAASSTGSSPGPTSATSSASCRAGRAAESSSSRPPTGRRHSRTTTLSSVSRTTSSAARSLRSTSIPPSSSTRPALRQRRCSSNGYGRPRRTVAAPGPRRAHPGLVAQRIACGDQAAEEVVLHLGAVAAGIHPGGHAAVGELSTRLSNESTAATSGTTSTLCPATCLCPCLPIDAGVHRAYASHDNDRRPLRTLIFVVSVVRHRRAPIRALRQYSLRRMSYRSEGGGRDRKSSATH